MKGVVEGGGVSQEKSSSKKHRLNILFKTRPKT